MDIHTATEEAYKRGFEDGRKAKDSLWRRNNMCERCLKLRETKVGFKTKIKITENTEMVLDRYKDHFDVFIHSYDTDIHDGSWLNYPFDITHCPFCGAKIEPFEEAE